MTEEIEIQIKLSADYWEQRYPSAKVYIDDILLFDEKVDNPVDINWKGSISEGNHKFIIELYNKKQGDTVMVDNKIVHDVLLNIDSILLDEIELNQLMWLKSVYYPVDTHAPEKVNHCVNLGWNGRWELEFESPTYMWLLENLE